jgi:hypothetical protein
MAPSEDSGRLEPTHEMTYRAASAPIAAPTARGPRVSHTIRATWARGETPRARRMVISVRLRPTTYTPTVVKVPSAITLAVQASRSTAGVIASIRSSTDAIEPANNELDWGGRPTSERRNERPRMLESVSARADSTRKVRAMDLAWSREGTGLTSGTSQRSCPGSFSSASSARCWERDAMTKDGG